MSKAKAYAVGTLGFLAISVGGPALTWYLRPTDEEIFQKFNPDLQKRSLENRERREKEFDEFVTKLKEYSKSDKPIWVVAAEEERKRRAQALEGSQTRILEESRIREELRGPQGSKK
ncbi:putative ubiquinol-cytochrome-c reductase assembly factor [Phaeomoniella chlamydospora]|uniref:Cytochrome b mRNA-processing protein 4 n=1 Tax=Phaeomoniella chlamydospora TaxID=158046 RepID=A0A0G2GET9_PHACM|nr:putative ubiquinol-cytochrome-c reductase assembly factor [Phaeomoniella chlamydospora]